MKIVTVSQASAMDKIAIEDYAIPEMILMENAANAACRIIREKICIEGNNCLLLCGTGNNGGDGLALARLIYSEGGAPLVLLNGSPEKLKGSALENYKILQNYPIEIIQIFTKERLDKELGETDYIIDALLGTGLNREISGALKDFVGTINNSKKVIFSIDIPTGINGNTGQVMGSAIIASHTISFGALKPGNILYPGYSHNGGLHLSRISFPPEIYDSEDFQLQLNICPSLPPRDEMGHKTTFGDILTISGAGSYYGAPVFAASAVMKSGGGFSRLATPASMVPFLASSLPGSVFLPMQETFEKSLALSSLEKLKREAIKSDAVIIGPGLSLNKETARVITDFIQWHEGSLIIDGDAISAIAGRPELISHKREYPVLTPHLGELSRLCGISIEEIKKNPIQVLRNCTELYQAIIVMKGAHSMIGFPNGKVFINMSGNSGMGTAGSGDILTGIIGAFTGMGMALSDAVKSAVFIHGVAGDLTAEERGKDGMTADDLLKKLPFAIKNYRENYNQLIEQYENLIQVI